MANFICTTCGTQYQESTEPPASCPICEDSRQYVKSSGQQWTTQDRLKRTHKNTLRLEEPGLISLGIEPHFAIGQRAFFLRSSAGNILWDCLPLLDPALAEALRAMGGVQAIAISHPHYYTSMIEWSRAFGNVPIYLHEADRQWVMRPDEAIHFWAGDQKKLSDGLTLLRCGGHFDGGTVLHWAGGAGGKGVVLSGDILQVAADRKHVGFMWSYPNWVPLNARSIRHIETMMDPFEYDRMYGAFWELTIESEAKDAVARSVERYLRAIKEV